MNWAWTAMILPQIEQKPVYDTLGISLRNADAALTAAFNNNTAAMRIALQTPIAVLQCPSDGDRPDLDLTTFRQGVVGGTNATNPHYNQNGWGLAMSNYVACNRGGGNEGPPVTTAAASTNANCTYVQSPNYIDAGAFAVSTCRRMASLVDGSSNVFFVGERAYEFRIPGGALRNSRAGLALVAKGSSVTSSGTGCTATECGLSDAGFTMGGFQINPMNNDNVARNGASSQHAGGAQFCMGDAKVTFVGENTDINVLRRLARIQDGQPVRVP
jgi:hypothetical protein